MEIVQQYWHTAEVDIFSALNCWKFIESMTVFEVNIYKHSFLLHYFVIRFYPEKSKGPFCAHSLTKVTTETQRVETV